MFRQVRITIISHKIIRKTHSTRLDYKFKYILLARSATGEIYLNLSAISEKI